MGSVPRRGRSGGVWVAKQVSGCITAEKRKSREDHLAVFPKVVTIDSCNNK